MRRDLHPVRRSRLADHAGNKALGLHLLLRRGFPVPRTFVCAWDAYEAHRAGDASVLPRLRSQLSRIVREDRPYAVRSSANLEDAVHRSFAGRFRSVLDVRGPDAVLEAILAVWASAGDAGVEGLRMAVLVQEMVPVVVSGIAFSLNPVTGRREVLLEAVRGSGEALQKNGATPLRYVHRQGRWAQRAEAGTIPDDVLDGLVRSVAAIEAAYGAPVDVEWVYDGRTVHFVQVRGITAVDEPIHSCRISREMLPGLIKPLVWSVNTSLVNPVWAGILARLSGDRTIRPEDLSARFYGRAYFNMTPFGKAFARLGFPKDALELLIGVEDDASGPGRRVGMKPGLRILRRLPAFLSFFVELLRIERPFLRFLQRMKPAYDALAAADPATLDAEGLRNAIARLRGLTVETARYSVLVPLLTMMYARMLRGTLAKAGADLKEVDLDGAFAEGEALRPTARLERLRALLEASGPTSEAFGTEFRRFLADFGHFSDSGNDFSRRPWRESPDLVLEMVRRTPLRSGQSTGLPSIGALRLPLMARLTVRFLLPRARRFAVHRERISSLYTYGYGQFRRYYLSFGERFVRQGLLEEAEDVFFLEGGEVDRIAAAGADPGAAWKETVRARRAELEQARDIHPPDTVFGRTAPPAVPAVGKLLQGVATSRGYYEGPARVLQGLSEMARLRPGDVLVIPYSDVGWTPLFAQAGAVVAESGGILSHSSITARELGIPAVVSVPQACGLADGTIVAVDGYRGEVRVRDRAPGEEKDKDG